MKEILKKTLYKLGLLAYIKRLRLNLPIYNYPLVNSKLPSHVILESMEEYHEYIKKTKDEFVEREKIEQVLIHQFPKSFLVKAPNFLLNNRNVLYKIDKQNQNGTSKVNLRETLVCMETGLHNRVRAALYAIQHSFPHERLSKSDVYLTEAVTSLFTWVEPLAKSVIGSEYLGETIKSGATINGVLHQDITSLSFANEMFDLGICLEVLEHVPAYKKAFVELARVTKSGGSMFISVPFIEQYKETITRATVNENGQIIHHLSPEYHGDPVNAESGILCFQHFGWDILQHLKEAGFQTVKAHFIWWENNMILGRHMIIFEAIKQ